MSLNTLLAITGFLLMLCVFANKVSDRFGFPALLLFLGLGMMAGTDGPGGIEFHDLILANHIGTVALAFILFSGGLDTQWSSVRNIALRGSILSTFGVFLTALFLYLFARYVLVLSFEISLLLSVIVSSTDAPAVFSILRSHHLHLKPDIKGIIEFESGSNDPMAVFLAMGAMTYLSNPQISSWIILGDFVLEMSLGIGFGVLFGFIAAKILCRWLLPYQGLYPVFGIALVLLTFSLTQIFYGNGFLAVYICGIMMGNNHYLYRRHFIRFQDSLAWVMQISMFLILGLLVNPHELPSIMPLGLACTLFLIFAARPLTVFLCLLGSKFSLKEQLFIGWAGFKGAVPIILATYPLINGFPNSQFLFNLIFFLVIISVLLQGQTLATLARLLHLRSTDLSGETHETISESDPAADHNPKL